MINRNDVVEKAIKDCLRELYSYAQPKIEYDDFIKECKEWSAKYSNKTDSPPKPYEFYYLDKDIMKIICDSYLHAYELDDRQELLDNIDTLKDYCKNPIVDKYIEEHKDENGNWHPGYRGYDHPDNLKSELIQYISDNFGEYPEKSTEELQEIFFKFLDMAGKFFKWDGYAQKFNFNVYLGISPNSNKEAVIKNWKKYRDKDIEINDLTIDDII